MYKPFNYVSLRRIWMMDFLFYCLFYRHSWFRESY